MSAYAFVISSCGAEKPRRHGWESCKTTLPIRVVNLVKKAVPKENLRISQSKPRKQATDEFDDLDGKKKAGVVDAIEMMVHGTGRKMISAFWGSGGPTFTPISRQCIKTSIWKDGRSSMGRGQFYQFQVSFRH